MSHTPTNRAPARLRDLVHRPDTVLFVGSGASAWAGYPSWYQLIQNLIAFLDAQGLPTKLVARELDRGDLVLAASYGFDQLTLAEQGSFLKEQFSRPPSPPSELHARLVQLGPRCFITTNYDKLLEDALASLVKGVRFRVVGNDTPLDEANIVSAHATNFIFKPHGDIDKLASIVLTREQYRTLQGSKLHAFETLKTLLVSRPVIFVGFGLRDPDFLLLKDILLSLYEGGSQDHYALLPDVDPLEQAYWRKNFGMHLVSYDRSSSNDPLIAHQSLLTLLDGLRADSYNDDSEDPAPPEQSHNSDSSLALLRHLHKEHHLAPRTVEVIPLHAEPVSDSFPWGPTRQRFYRRDAIEALASATESLILVGPPGSGKSFVTRSAISKIAETASNSLLEGAAGGSEVKVPVYIELKAYAGSLRNMLAAALPVNFSIENAIQRQQLVVFVDGVNEVPYSALDDNSFYRDLELFGDLLRENLLVLVTRFSTDQAIPNLPKVELDSIPTEFLETALADMGRGEVSSGSELLRLLSRPVYFRFFREHGMPDNARSPHDLYEAMLTYYDERASIAFKRDIDLGTLFAELGYSLVETGQQLMGARQLLDSIKEHLNLDDPRALMSWLITEGPLVPYEGDRVALFHHSMTEYMAALAVSAKQRTDPDLPIRLIATRRWDHALLLTLGFLPSEQQGRFLNAMIRADPVTAMRSLSFLDADRTVWTSRVLNDICDRDYPFEIKHSLAFALGRAQLTADDINALERLADSGDALGGEAVSHIVRLGHSDACKYAIDQVVRNPGDYNFGSHIGRALGEIANQELFETLVDLLVSTPRSAAAEAQLRVGSEVDDLHGLIEMSRHIFEAVPFELLETELDSVAFADPLVRAILLDVLHHNASLDALLLTCRLADLSPRQALVTLNFQASYADPDPDALSALLKHGVGRLILSHLDGEDSGWAADLLHELTSMNSDWGLWAADLREHGGRPILRALRAWGANDEPAFFSALEDLLGDPTSLDGEDLAIGGLSHCSVNWSDQPELLISLLRLRCKSLAQALIESLDRPLSADRFSAGSGIGDIWSWVSWVGESRSSDEWFFRERISRFIAIAANDEERSELLGAFPGPDDVANAVLADWVLPCFQGLSSSEFKPSASGWLVRDLARTKADHFSRDPLLATIADERFVEETLIPIFRVSDDSATRRNLVSILEAAGQRHGRRYVTAEGDLL